jgi:hypothetical protein
LSPGYKDFSSDDAKKYRLIVVNQKTQIENEAPQMTDSRKTSIIQFMNYSKMILIN